MSENIKSLEEIIERLGVWWLLKSIAGHAVLRFGAEAVELSLVEAAQQIQQRHAAGSLRETLEKLPD